MILLSPSCHTFKLLKPQTLFFVFLYFSFFLHSLLSFLTGKICNCYTFDSPKLSWWDTPVADIITSCSVVHGKLRSCGGEPELKSRDGAQLTLQSAKYVALSCNVISRLVVPASLHWVGENILEKTSKENEPLQYNGFPHCNKLCLPNEQWMCNFCRTGLVQSILLFLEVVTWASTRVLWVRIGLLWLLFILAGFPMNKGVPGPEQIVELPPIGSRKM